MSKETEAQQGGEVAGGEDARALLGWADEIESTWAAVPALRREHSAWHGRAGLLRRIAAALRSPVVQPEPVAWMIQKRDERSHSQSPHVTAEPHFAESFTRGNRAEWYVVEPLFRAIAPVAPQAVPAPPEAWAVRYAEQACAWLGVRSEVHMRYFSAQFAYALAGVNPDGPYPAAPVTP